LNCVRAAVPHLKTRGGGSVVLVGSRSQWFPPDQPQIAYASSKGALLSAMYHLVRELGPDKIRVNMVVPTWMWGPPVQMYVKWQASERGVEEQDVIDEITSGMPLGEEIPAAPSRSPPGPPARAPHRRAAGALGASENS